MVDKINYLIIERAWVIDKISDVKQSPEPVSLIIIIIYT